MPFRLKLLFSLGLASLFVFGYQLVAPGGNTNDVEGADKGKELFQANCLGCHSIGGGDGVGPDLMGITEKRETDWLVEMIKDPQALVDSGDEIANELVEEYGMVMPQTNLSSAEIDAIVGYLESASSQEGSAASSQESEAGKTQQLTTQMFALFGFIGTLILLIMMAVIWRKRLKGVRRNLH